MIPGCSSAEAVRCGPIVGRRARAAGCRSCAAPPRRRAGRPRARCPGPGRRARRAAAPRRGCAGAAASAAPAGSPPSAGSAAAFAGEIGARLGRDGPDRIADADRRLAADRLGRGRRREIRSRAGCASAAPSVSRARSVERSSRKAWSGGAPPARPLSGARGLAIAAVTDGGRAGRGDRVVALARRRVPGARDRRRRVDRGQLRRRRWRRPRPAAMGAQRQRRPRRARRRRAVATGAVERP